MLAIAIIALQRRTPSSDFPVQANIKRFWPQSGSCQYLDCERILIGRRILATNQDLANKESSNQDPTNKDPANEDPANTSVVKHSKGRVHPLDPLLGSRWIKPFKINIGTMMLIIMVVMMTNKGRQQMNKMMTMFFVEFLPANQYSLLWPQ